MLSLAASGRSGRRARRFTRIVALPLMLFAGSCTVLPEATDETARAARLEADLAAVEAARFTPDRPITLYEAMARAVAFNLQSRVKALEADLADVELRQSNLEFLPNLDASGGLDRQNRATSRTTDRIQNSAQAGFAWNILDLGVSYARAKQQANQVMVAREHRRKAFNDILRDVRLAYWRVSSAQRLMRQAGALSGRIQKAVGYSQELQAERDRDAKVSIAYRRALLESVRTMVAFRREVADARAQLAELINVDPNAELRLAEARELHALPSLPFSAEEMERRALLNRAELRTEEYQKQIEEWRVREQLYSLLPGLDLSIGGNYASDSFLLSRTWATSGVQLGMNLFNLFSLPGRLEQQEKTGELAESRRRAVVMAVLAQVHIARRQYGDALYQFALSRRIADADRDLTGLVRLEAQLADGGFLETIEAGAREMRTGLDEHRAWLEVLRAHNALIHAVGAHALPEELESAGVQRIAVALRHQYADWDSPSSSSRGLTIMPLVRLIEAALPSAPAEPVPEVRSASAGAPLDLAALPLERVVVVSRSTPFAWEDGALEGLIGHSRIAAAGKAPERPIPAVLRPADGPSPGPADGIGADAAIAAGGEPLSAMGQPDDETGAASGPRVPPPPPMPRNGQAGASETGIEADFERDARSPLAIQVGAYRSRTTANDVMQRLRASLDETGYSGRVHSDRVISAQHGNLHAVRIGPIRDRSRASALCRDVRRQGFDCMALRPERIAVALLDGSP